jgi:hypothetical protein
MSELVFLTADTPLHIRSKEARIPNLREFARDRDLLPFIPKEALEAAILRELGKELPIGNIELFLLPARGANGTHLFLTTAVRLGRVLGESLTQFSDDGTYCGACRHSFHEGKVYIEEYQLAAEPSDALDVAIARLLEILPWHRSLLALLKDGILIVPEKRFAELCSVLPPIEERRSPKELISIEYLPIGTVFVFTRTSQDADPIEGMLQLGSGASLGRGFCRLGHRKLAVSAPDETTEEVPLSAAA